jgi:hypothetical protein
MDQRSSNKIVYQGGHMKKLILSIVIAFVFGMAFTAAASMNIANAANTVNNNTPASDQRDNNAPLVNQGNRTGNEPNYLNPEGHIMSYSTSAVHRNWSWLGFVGLLGLVGLVGRSKKSETH